MTRETTYPLYVNLSASQTRKRLKGYGFGVRKVEAADRNQAVIIHTATGDHLRRLQSLFADVLSSPSQEGVGTPIENLRNLGPSSAAWLRGVGVHSRADLQRLGPAIVYRLAKRKYPNITLNLLWAMEAALRDKNILDITEDEKAKLLADSYD
jgi:hypothetical protein